MTLTATTHLNLPGTARAALEFYASIFGGSVVATTYAEVGAPADSPDADKVVFGRLDADAGFALMAYDIPGGAQPFTGETRRQFGTTVTDQPFFISLSGASLDELTGYWELLSVDATIVEPLAASAWSAGFGMLTDAFGVTWAASVVDA
jgi:PhnB protein